MAAWKHGIDQALAGALVRGVPPAEILAFLERKEAEVREIAVRDRGWPVETLDRVGGEGEP
mgnify:CR=1 FL=1